MNILKYFFESDGDSSISGQLKHEPEFITGLEGSTHFRYPNPKYKTTPHVSHTEYPRYKTSFNTWVKYWQSKGVFIASNKQFSNN